MEREKESSSQILLNKKDVLRCGMRDGIPIGLGYLAVSFSLGIAAQNAGLSPFQGFLASLLCNASAGEYAGFTLIATGATYIEVAIITFITNARYLLMSCAMSQRMKPGHFAFSSNVYSLRNNRRAIWHSYFASRLFKPVLQLWQQC